jgi:hypothetical protein
MAFSKSGPTRIIKICYIDVDKTNPHHHLLNKIS